MSVFVHAQGIKNDHAEGGGSQNSVHVVVECPLRYSKLSQSTGNSVEI